MCLDEVTSEPMEMRAILRKITPTFDGPSSSLSADQPISKLQLRQGSCRLGLAISFAACVSQPFLGFIGVEENSCGAIRWICLLIPSGLFFQVADVASISGKRLCAEFKLPREESPANQAAPLVQPRPTPSGSADASAPDILERPQKVSKQQQGRAASAASDWCSSERCLSASVMRPSG